MHPSHRKIINNNKIIPFVRSISISLRSVRDKDQIVTWCFSGFLTNLKVLGFDSFFIVWCVLCHFTNLFEYQIVYLKAKVQGHYLNLRG